MKADYHPGPAFDVLGKLRAAEAEVSRRTLRGYFIAEDGDGDVWLWRENGDRPMPVLAERDCRDLKVWAILAAAVGGDRA